MRMINIQKDGEDYIAPPQTVQVENKIEQPIQQPTVLPEKPQSKGKALLYLLFIPLLFGAVWLGQFAVSKTNKYFMNKRDEIIEDKINEKKEEKKERQQEEKKNYYIVLTLIVGDNQTEEYALVLKDIASKDIVVEDYFYNSVKLKLNGEEMHVGANFADYSETNPDISNSIYGPDKIKHIVDNYYIKYETEYTYFVYHKAYVSYIQEGNYESWIGFVIYENNNKTGYTESEAREYINKIKDKIEIIPLKEVKKDYVKLRDYFEENEKELN